MPGTIRNLTLKHGESNMMTSLKRRLDRIEQQRGDGFADVRAWVRAGRRYDGLADDEKDRYSCYLGIDRAVIEQVHLAITGGLDFPLFTVEKATPQKIRTIAAEVEQIVLDGSEQ